MDDIVKKVKVFTGLNWYLLHQLGMYFLLYITRHPPLPEYVLLENFSLIDPESTTPRLTVSSHHFENFFYNFSPFLPLFLLLLIKTQINLDMFLCVLPSSLKKLVEKKTKLEDFSYGPERKWS